MIKVMACAHYQIKSRNDSTFSHTYIQLHKCIHSNVKKSNIKFYNIHGKNVGEISTLLLTLC